MRATLLSAFVGTKEISGRKRFWTCLVYLTPVIFGLLLVDEIALALIIIRYQIQLSSEWLLVVFIPELPAIWCMFVIFKRRGNDIGLPSFFAAIAALSWPLCSLSPLILSMGILSIKENSVLATSMLLGAIAHLTSVLIYGALPGRGEKSVDGIAEGRIGRSARPMARRSPSSLEGAECETQRA